MQSSKNPTRFSGGSVKQSKNKSLSDDTYFEIKRIPELTLLSIYFASEKKQAINTTIIAKRLDFSYPYGMYVIRLLLHMGWISTQKKGRTKVLVVTAKGKKVAEKLSDYYESINYKFMDVVQFG